MTIVQRLLHRGCKREIEKQMANPVEEGGLIGAGLSLTPQDLPWFALRVRSNFEQKSAALLRQRGYEEFSPTYRRRSYWSDRIKWVDRPLFPGYVFCRFSQRNWLPVLQTPGIVQAVSFGGKPAPVDHAEIESLRILVRSPLPLFPRAFLHVGQKVRIRRGPLAGLEGVIEEFGKNCRIVVSVTLLQRSVSAEVDAEWLEGAG
jgi:transcription antitermination factor NusG